MYVLAKAVFSNRDGALLAGVLSCCLTFGWYLNLTPNELSNMFMPFALFLIIKYLQKGVVMGYCVIDYHYPLSRIPCSYSCCSGIVSPHPLDTY